MKGSKEKVPSEGFGIPPVARWRAGWFSASGRGKPKVRRGGEKVSAGKRVPLAFRNNGGFARCPLFERQENCGQNLTRGS